MYVYYNPAKFYIKCVNTGGVRDYIKYTKVIVQNTSRIRLVDVQFPITAIPPPPSVTTCTGELGQLVQVGPAREGITIDIHPYTHTHAHTHTDMCVSGNQLGRGAICRQFLVRGGLQPVFDFPSRCLAYREGSIDFHDVDWRPIKGWCHLAEFGEVVPNFLCAPSQP